MYLFRRISEEKNLTKGTRGRVDIYQSVHADLNYLIGCAKSNVHSLDDNLPNWHVHVKEPNQKYHPGCVFCSEGLTTFYSGFGTIEDDKYECKTKVFIYNVDYIPNNLKNWMFHFFLIMWMENRQMNSMLKPIKVD